MLHVQFYVHTFFITKYAFSCHCITLRITFKSHFYGRANYHKERASERLTGPGSRGPTLIICLRAPEFLVTPLHDKYSLPVLNFLQIVTPSDVMLISVLHGDNETLLCNTQCATINLLHYIRRSTHLDGSRHVDLANESGMSPPCSGGFRGSVTGDPGRSECVHSCA